jgi:hypothetical protein
MNRETGTNPSSIRLRSSDLHDSVERGIDR